MVNCMCMVQAGQAPDRAKGKLLAVLNSFTRSSFGQEAQVAWIPVGPGNGFTAGKPSTSSVVAMTAAVALSTERREALLREFVAQWTRSMGCTVDEIVAVISDPVEH